MVVIEKNILKAYNKVPPKSVEIKHAPFEVLCTTCLLHFLQGEVGYQQPTANQEDERMFMSILCCLDLYVHIHISSWVQLT